MQQKEWLACKEPGAMLAHLGVGPHWGWVEQEPGMWVPGRKKTKYDRKLRLFACACCRRIWNLLVDEACRKAVEVAEQFADGNTTRARLRGANVAAARCSLDDDEICSLEERRLDQALVAALNASGQPFNPLHAALNAAEASGKEKTEKLAQCALLRDVIGNPFRASAPDKVAWGSTVKALALAIYDGDTFGDLPILADALEETGQAADELIAHCRDSEKHVRGCWVVDLLTGRQ